MDRKIIILLALVHLCVAYLVMLQKRRSVLPNIVDGKGANASGTQTYIVHVQEPEGGTKLLGEEELRNWYKSFLPNTTLDSGVPRLVYSYRHAISGFAARLTAEEVRAMQFKDGFLYAHPDNELVGATTYTTKDFLGLGQTGSPWFTTTGGEGMIIGMIDSGITLGHPSFLDDGTLPAPPTKWTGQCLLCPYPRNNKLIGAVGFLGGSPASPIDQHGHGTHTAGTAAGNPVDADVLGNAKGRAVGAAPRAHLAIYRVLDENGRGSERDFLRGIDQAIKDGVDVLSMSLSSTQPIPLYQSSIAVASFSAIIQGIFPSAAAGNSGPQESSIVNDAPWLLTVGASSFDRRITATVKLGDGTELHGDSACQAIGTPQLPLIYPGIILHTEQARVCDYSSIVQLDAIKGKIVLCEAGVIDEIAKGLNIRAAGGAGMIVMNPQEQGFTTSAHPHVLPASHLSNRDAQQIIHYLRVSRSPTAEIIFKGTKFGARPRPTVASFSSRGPSLMNGGILKPDILGPGVNVLAAWPFQLAPAPTGSASFNFQSGTSMATPHLSGIAAMIKKHHSDWSPAAIKSAIMTTARTLDLDISIIKDDATDHKRARHFAMGAGHVRPTRAMDPGLVYDLRPDDYIPYLCGVYDVNIVQAIVRQRVDCSAYQPIGAEDLNYPSCALTLAPGEKKIIGRNLTNVGSDSSYSLRIVEPAGVGVIAEPYHLQFSQLHGKQSFRLQFTNKADTSMAGMVSEGYLEWFSLKHTVRSPIVVTFTSKSMPHACARPLNILYICMFVVLCVDQNHAMLV